MNSIFSMIGLITIALKFLRDADREAISPVELTMSLYHQLTINLQTHDQMAIKTTLCYDLNMFSEPHVFVNYKVHIVSFFSIYELLIL